MSWCIYIYSDIFLSLVIINWKLAFLTQLLELIMPIRQFKIIGNVFGNWIFVLIAITHLWFRVCRRASSCGIWCTCSICMRGVSSGRSGPSGPSVWSLIWVSTLSSVRRRRVVAVVWVAWASTTIGFSFGRNSWIKVSGWGVLL